MSSRTKVRPDAVRVGDWHALPADEVLASLGSSRDGLTAEEASGRLASWGPNRLAEAPSVSKLKLLLEEFMNPLVLILLGAAALLGVVGLLDEGGARVADAALILAIVVLNALLGFTQNYQAHRGIEALKRLAAPSATFLRNGRVVAAGADELVPGDVALLEEGDRVPADGRLLEAYELHVDESALTGESQPVAKTADAVAAEAPLAERGCMAYLGTVVISGRGLLAVTETGMRTQVGAIAEEIQTAEDRPTPFQREVASLGKRLTLIIAALIALISVLQLTVGGFSLLETFVAAVALAVAAIPEGLPVVMTLALAFATRRMLWRRCLVRSLPVVEIVGSAEVICADKTGTITEGRMGLRRVHAPDRALVVTGEAVSTEGEFLEDGRASDQRANPVLLAGALCNNAHAQPDGGFVGDPTEVALLAGALKAGVDVDAWTRVDEVPFSSERRMMTVVAARDGRPSAFTKGAPEVVLGRCARVRVGGEEVPLTATLRSEILSSTERLAAEALRVLALARREPAPRNRGELERDLVFLGLVGLSDPARREARPSLDAAADAGIRVVMITGDNLSTAEAVAREVGILGRGMQGRELESLDDPELEAAVERVGIFARTEPGQKLAILRALQAHGRVVAMTGDGVNDAPALKGADVGIAMGVRGTDVARDASDMVLLDDNVATIVAAIEEGRRVFANIRKFVNYLLTGNLAEVLVILAGSLMGYLPVTALMILWINLVTDSGPAVALGIDPPAPGLMRRPPHRGPIIGRAMLALIGGVGAVMAAIIFASFLAGLALYDLPTAQTIAFTALVVQEYLRIGVIRYRERVSLLANRWLVIAVGVSLVLQVVLIYVRPVGELFGTVPLGPVPWLILLGGLAIGFIAALRVTSLVVRRLGPL